MPRVQRDDKGLYIKFRDQYARPMKAGHTPSPLAPLGTHIREQALVEVKLFLGDSRRLLVDIVPDGKYIIAEGKFTEVWYLDKPVNSPPKGKRNAQKHKTKGSVRRRNVGSNTRSRKKVGNTSRNNSNGSRNRVGGSKVRPN